MAQAGILAVIFGGLLLAALGLLWGVRRRTQRALGAGTQAFQAVAGQLQAKLQELETSRSQMAGLLDSMEEGVLAVGPRGEILVLNPAARAILGIEPEAGPGAAAGGLIRQPELRELLTRTLATGHEQREDLALYAPVERSLRVRTTTCECAPLGRCVLMVLHDITDLKRLEQLRREFVANVSHELKTPLTAIRGAVETLLDGALHEPAHARAFVETIAEESARLHRLVDDLLTLAQVEARPAAMAREPVALADLLAAEVARHQRLAAAQQVSLTLEVAPATLTVRADRGQLIHAVANLLENAIKYNRPGGRVIVRARADGGHCRLEVEDTGIGIPLEDLPRIFERFYRVDKARSRETGGTGLGLSIVKHVADAHGGTVEVTSRAGQGSCFTLRLPLT